MAHLRVPPLLNAAGEPLLHGRSVVLTGGTRGIGFEVARGLVARGADVVITGHRHETGVAAVTALQREHAGARVTFQRSDFADLDDVRRLAASIAAQHRRVDLLVHNAAVVTPMRVVTSAGLETQFTVNHLAVVLLTHELMPALAAAREPGIVVTASQMEQSGRMDFDDLTGARTYDAMRAYSTSKLANVLFTYELAARLRGTAFTVNCLHPGVARTDLLDMLERVQRNRTTPQTPARAILSVARGTAGRALRAVGLRPMLQDPMPPPSVAGEMTLAVALAPEARAVSGSYFRDGEVGRTSPASHDVALRRRLWNVTAGLVGIDPGWPAVSRAASSVDSRGEAAP